MKRTHLITVLFLGLATLLSEAKAQSLFTVEVKGKGRPMILIHGLYCTGEVWKETVEHYQKNYECHILTLAGFGGNAAAVNDHFMESVKDDIILYVKNKKLNKPVIMGHSMGGFLTFWAAASAPGLFEKAIAVDGYPYLGSVAIPGSTPETAKPMALNAKNVMSNQTPEQIESYQLQYLPSMISSPDHIREVAKIASKADSKTQAEVMYELYTIDLQKTVASIDCPVLFMCSWVAYKNYGATHDGMASIAKGQTSLVKNCTIEITDTARHFIFYDDPAWFFNKTDGFLASK